MKNGSPNRRVFFMVTAAVFFARLAGAQIPMSAGTYSQNFDSFATNGTGNGWTDNATLPGWYAATNLTAAKSGGVTFYNAGTGSSASGALYSFGDNASPDRALGSLASGGPGNFAYGVRFTNDTAWAQTNFIISYTGEEWRAANASTQKLVFACQTGSILTNADALNSQNWTAFPALDFSSPNTNVSSAVRGNDPTNQTVFAGVVLTGAVVQPGQEIFFRWYDADDAGLDDGLAIDNFTVAFSATAASTNALPVATVLTNGTITLLTYNVNGNAATNDWSTNAAQVQAVGRELVYLNPDIITFNEIPYTNTWQMANWITAFLPGFYLATNSGTDGSIRNVIASRFPITRSKSWLDNSSLAPYGYTGTGFTRDLFEAQLAVPNWPLPLHVFVAHLKATGFTTPQDDADKRAAMASAVSNFFVNIFLPGTNGSHPYVLSGDMNEDVFQPDSDYTSGQPIQRLTSAPTGLQLTTPVNPFWNSPSNDYTESIRNPLDTRFDYIFPCGLLFSNLAGGEVFRTDLLTTFPPNLFSNDDKIASDHLPVLIVFANPFDTPFKLLSIARSNQAVTLEWESQNNRTFNIEASTDLFSWTPFATNLSATTTNSPFVFTSNNVGDAIKFFRIHRVP
jgi:endonuclease/exonuclease/phosphatase family metal-dependent hydrolase